MAHIKIKTKDDGVAVWVWELFKKLDIEVVEIGFGDNEPSVVGSSDEFLGGCTKVQATKRKVCSAECCAAKGRKAVEGFDNNNRK